MFPMPSPKLCTSVPAYRCSLAFRSAPIHPRRRRPGRPRGGGTLFCARIAPARPRPPARVLRRGAFRAPDCAREAAGARLLSVPAGAFSGPSHCFARAEKPKGGPGSRLSACILLHFPPGQALCEQNMKIFPVSCRKKIDACGRADTTGLSLGRVGRLRPHIVAPDPDPGPISGPPGLPRRRQRSAAEGVRPVTAGCARLCVQGWAPDRGPGRQSGARGQRRGPPSGAPLFVALRPLVTPAPPLSPPRSPCHPRAPLVTPAKAGAHPGLPMPPQPVKNGIDRRNLPPEPRLDPGSGAGATVGGVRCEVAGTGCVNPVAPKGVRADAFGSLHARPYD